MASNSNESDKKLSELRRRSQFQTPSQGPSSSSRSASSGNVAKRSLLLSNSRKSSSRQERVALFMSRRENPLPKSRLSVSSGSGSRERHDHREPPPSLPDNDDMPSLEYDPPPQCSSYHYPEYNLFPEVDNFFRHFRDDASGPLEYTISQASYDYGHSSKNKFRENCDMM